MPAPPPRNSPMHGRLSIERVTDSTTRVTLDVPDPPPVPAGYRFACWSCGDGHEDEPAARQVSESPRAGLRTWAAALDDLCPLAAVAVPEDGGGPALVASYHVGAGRWDGWAPAAGVRPWAVARPPVG